MNIAIVLLQILWFLLAGASALFTLLLFAFADSPDLGKRASRIFFPVTFGGLTALCAGAWLIRTHGNWWSFPLAYVLAILPPVVVTACYKWIRF